MELKMSKKLILGLALASVLVGSPFTGAKAADFNDRCWAALGYCPAYQQRDMDRQNAICQGANNYIPSSSGY